MKQCLCVRHVFEGYNRKSFDVHFGLLIVLSIVKYFVIVYRLRYAYSVAIIASSVINKLVYLFA